MPDPFQVDEHRIKLFACECGSIGPARSHLAPGELSGGKRCGLRCEQMDFVPVSVVAAHRDALREISEAKTLEAVHAILANGPLATAPGGLDEGECFRLREQVAARDETLERRDVAIEFAHAALDAAGVAREDRGVRLSMHERIARLVAQVAALTEEVAELERSGVGVMEALERAGVQTLGHSPHRSLGELVAQLAADRDEALAEVARLTEEGASHAD